MNGAQALINTLVDGGVDVCFANPGTSEMHFVAALDTVPQMRGVLTLFEGIATGAADGYARIAGRPAAVLLHLGPGLGNGLANLHNARRARVPMVVVVGDHATYHKKYDAPLESDIDALAGSVSGWVHRTSDTADIAADAAEAIAETLANNQISTLILPADTSWTDGAGLGEKSPRQPKQPDVDADAVETARRGIAIRRAHGAPDRWRRHPRRRAWQRPHESPRQPEPVGIARHFRRGWNVGPGSRRSTGSRISPRPWWPNSRAPNI